MSTEKPASDRGRAKGPHGLRLTEHVWIRVWETGPRDIDPPSPPSPPTIEREATFPNTLRITLSEDIEPSKERARTLTMPECCWRSLGQQAEGSEV